jgi:hypothetical protein
MATLSSLPNEMLLRILASVSSASDVANICSMSRHVAGAAQEALYSQVELKRDPLALTLLVHTFLGRPAFARMVKVLHLSVAELQWEGCSDDSWSRSVNWSRSVPGIGRDFVCYVDHVNNALRRSLPSGEGSYIQPAEDDPLPGVMALNNTHEGLLRYWLIELRMLTEAPVGALLLSLVPNVVDLRLEVARYNNMDVSSLFPLQTLFKARPGRSFAPLMAIFRFRNQVKRLHLRGGNMELLKIGFGNLDVLELDLIEQQPQRLFTNTIFGLDNPIASGPKSLVLEATGASFGPDIALRQVLRRFSPVYHAQTSALLFSAWNAALEESTMIRSVVLTSL